MIIASLYLAGCTPSNAAQVTPTALLQTASIASDVPPGCAPLGYEQVSQQGTFSPDKRMVVVTANHATAIYDTQTQLLRDCLDVVPGPDPTFVFSADSTMLVEARALGFTIKLWQLDAKAHVIFTTSSLLETISVVFSPDNKLLAILGWDGTGSSHFLGGTLKIWKLSSGQLMQQFDDIYGIRGFSADSLVLDVGICTLKDSLCGATETRHLAVYL